ncbi:MAG: drug/metabolite exporter YedA [Anaerolineae bacterium]|nr:drug/metabolite exporter YedA [Anaerolineae bacterium]
MATQLAAGSESKSESGVQGLPVDVLLALLATYFVWGTTYLAAHFALESFPAFLITGVRFLTAGSLLFVFLRWRGMAIPTRLEARNAAIIGVFLLAGGMGLTTFSMNYLASGLVAINVASIPIWSALFAGLRGQWPRRGEWIGIALGFLGVGLLGVDALANTNVIGILLAQAGAILWSFGSVWSRDKQLPKGMMGFAVEMLAGGSALLLIGLLRGEWITKPILLESVLGWLYLVFFGSLVAFSSYMYLLRKVQPALATSYAYVNPVIALIVGALFASEQINAASVLAMVLILAGLAIMTTAARRATA